MITKSQFTVLRLLLDGEKSGRVLRARLVARGVSLWSSPVFYQMMAELEDGKHVEGWYDEKVIGGMPVKERRYRITESGKRVLAERPVELR